MTSVAQRAVTGLHAAAFRLSGGRIGGRVGKASVLLLTTVGRRSGQERVAPLLYVEDDGGYAIIASNGGSASHPAWFANLQAKPEAEVRIGKRRVPVRAEVAEGDERERLWRRFTDVYAGYDGYQTRTSRQIPVVRLRPP